ncbi:MAG TPA: hypothetical protein VFH06_04060 [Candidatus Saccharimonadales bacterium]|nr:hypothetical protein [Candidatus Saccharimonadales bacterium]
MIDGLHSTPTDVAGGARLLHLRVLLDGTERASHHRASDLLGSRPHLGVGVGAGGRTKVVDPDLSVDGRAELEGYGSHRRSSGSRRYRNGARGSGGEGGTGGLLVATSVENGDRTELEDRYRSCDCNQPPDNVEESTLVHAYSPVDVDERDTQTSLSLL